MPAAPKVFVSYSHDNDAHKAQVLALADRLCASGVDATIDQYQSFPEERWPRWCKDQIEVADFVLMVCTEIYHRRVAGKEESGHGVGVCREAPIIQQLLYNAGSHSRRFVQVLFSDGSTKDIPTELQGFSDYIVDTQSGYEDL